MNYIYFALLCFVILKFGKIKIFFIHLKDFIYWKFHDLRNMRHLKKLGLKVFREYGLKMFVGRQGDGKTVSLVNRLNELHEEYPNALIYTNFDYKYRDFGLESLIDLLHLDNGENGVIVGFDEIQNEFSSAASKDFPESVLSTITQQRKRKIVIYATSQVFTRVAKPLREQCFEVIECKTFLGRWTRMKCFDADDYNYMIDCHDMKEKFKIKRKWRRSFIQSDELRNDYDTYEVIKRLSRQGFVRKNHDC